MKMIKGYNIPAPGAADGEYGGFAGFGDTDESFGGFGSYWGDSGIAAPVPALNGFGYFGAEVIGGGWGDKTRWAQMRADYEAWVKAANTPGLSVRAWAGPIPPPEYPGDVPSTGSGPGLSLPTQQDGTILPFIAAALGAYLGNKQSAGMAFVGAIAGFVAAKVVGGQYDKLAANPNALQTQAPSLTSSGTPSTQMLAAYFGEVNAAAGNARDSHSTGGARYLTAHAQPRKAKRVNGYGDFGISRIVAAGDTPGTLSLPDPAPAPSGGSPSGSGGSVIGVKAKATDFLFARRNEGMLVDQRQPATGGGTPATTPADPSTSGGKTQAELDAEARAQAEYDRLMGGGGSTGSGGGSALPMIGAGLLILAKFL
jgi:hypothetical protein